MDWFTLFVIFAPLLLILISVLLAVALLLPKRPVDSLIAHERREMALDTALAQHDEMVQRVKARRDSVRPRAVDGEAI